MGLKAEDAEVVLISPNPDKIQMFNHYDKAATSTVDRNLGDDSADGYDALVLPAAWEP